MNLCSMKYILVLFILLHAGLGLKLLTTTYTTHSVQIDNRNSFEAILFTFTFDENLNLVYMDNQDYEIPYLCFAPITCYIPTTFTLGLYSMLTLNCPSQTIGSVPSLSTDFDGESPASFLNVFQGSKEPLVSFFAPYFNITGAVVTTNPMQLNAFLITTYTADGLPILVGGKTRSQLSNELSKCTFTFKDGYNYYMEDSSKNHFAGTYGQIKPADPTPCSYSDSLQISGLIRDTINNMSMANSWTEIQVARFKTAVLASSNSLTSCQALIDQYLTSKTGTTTYSNTTDCLKNVDDPTFGTDPCCNITLQYHQCCAYVDKTLPSQTLETVNDNAKKCLTVDRSTAVLNDYIINTNSALDPFTGCRATSAKEANTADINKYSAFVPTCLYRIYGSDLIYGNNRYSCNNDSDCFTHCTIDKTCYVDFEDPDTAMLDCQLKLIDPTLVTLLKIAWGLPSNISDADFRQAYFNNMSSDNCVGYTSQYYTFGQNVEGEYGWIGEEYRSKSDCLAATYCNDADDPLCEQPGQVCLVDGIYSGQPLQVSKSPLCVEYISTNASECKAKGGHTSSTVGGDGCILPYNVSECLPSNVCPTPKFVDGGATNCWFSMCYDPSRNQAQCTSSYTWYPDWANGNGLCRFTDANSKTDCSKVNGTWWPGREWTPGVLNTEDTCTAGICQEGVYYNQSPCKGQSACSQACHSCVSSGSFGDLCYTAQLNVDQCTSVNGSYIPDYEICLLNYDSAASCQASGYTFATCNSLTKDQCDQCANGTCPQYYDLMGCYYSWKYFCPDEEHCENYGGSCSDVSVIPNRGACADYDDECWGFCLQDFVLFPNGLWGCAYQFDLDIALGCVVQNISHRSDCLAQGFTWHKPATNQEECESAVQCLMPDLTTTVQDRAQCNECHGTYQPIFTWSKGEWVPGVPENGTWVAKKNSTQNVWRKTLDYNIIYDQIDHVVAQRFAVAVQTESMCLYNPMFEAINQIVCDCAHDPDAPHPCYNDGARLIPVGIQRFYAGINDSIKASSIGLSVFDTTVPPELVYLDVDIDACYASQFRLKQSLSSDALGASLDNSPFAIIKNSHGATVAQLVGDGAVLRFLPKNSVANSAAHAAFSNAASNSGNFVGDISPPPSAFKLKNPMQVCISLRSDIQKSHEFNVPDFVMATDNFTTWTIQNVTVTTDQGYCFMAVQDGSYFPILRVPDYLTKTSNTLITDKALRAFIYIFGVWMLLLSFLCIYQMWIAAGNAYATRRLNLGLVLFFFMFLFCLVRALYLLMLPSGHLAKHQGANNFFSEAPQFFFFSVYSVIIFAWAELSLTVVPRSFLHRFKWPFIVTNGLLYLLFILVLSIYHSLSADQAVTLRKVYVCILASCCIAAVIGFNAFGGNLIVVQYRAKRATSVHTSNKNSTLKKLFILLPVSSVSILAQIAFLFVVTFSHVSPQVALTAYVITEVIPATTLIFTLRPLSRKLNSEQKQKDKEKGTPSAELEIVESGSSGSSQHFSSTSMMSMNSNVSNSSSHPNPPNPTSQQVGTSKT